MYPSALSKQINRLIFDPANKTENRFAIHTLRQMQTEFAGWNDEPLRLNGYELFWIKNGRGELWIDESCQSLRDEMIILLPPGHVRKIHLEDPAEGYFIYFLPEFLWMSGLAFTKPVLPDNWGQHAQLTGKQDEVFLEELEEIVVKMLNEFTNAYEKRTELLKALLHVFILYITRHLKTTGQQESYSREGELVRQFMNSLKKNFLHQKSVSAYASELFVTPNYLNRIIKKITGLTVSQQIQKCIVQEAKRKAIYTKCSMKEIAYGLGFDNLAHFSKFFRNYSGMNFSKFRANAIRAVV